MHEEPQVGAADGTGGAAPTADALLRDEATTTAQLVALWLGHDAESWRRSPHLYTQLARRFLKAAHPVLAHEVLSEARGRDAARDPVLEHLYGLVLARSGATERAAAGARALRAGARADPVLYADVLGLLGRTEKDLALRAPTAADGRRHLRRALAVYRGAFRRTGQSYVAINAATMALLLGRAGEAAALAAEARAAALRERRQGPRAGEAAYWQDATLGEAALLTGDRREAERRYAAAVRAASGELTDLSAMRRQARLILAHRGEPTDGSTRCSASRASRCSSARCPIRPARAPPSSRRPRSRSSPRPWPSGSRPSTSASASAGSEILFLEAVQARGGQTTVGLPYARVEFVRRRVAGVPGGNWVDRFERVLAASLETMEVSQSADTGVTADYAALLLMGLAGMQSQILDTELVPLAVWDGVETPGSPAATIRLWSAQGHDLEVMTPPRVEAVHA